jgi:hypothetical protein
MSCKFIDKVINSDFETKFKVVDFCGSDEDKHEINCLIYMANFLHNNSFKGKIESEDGIYTLIENRLSQISRENQ